MSATVTPAIPAAPSRRRRRMTAAAALLLTLWLAFVGYVDWAMHQPPEVFGRIMAHMPVPAYFLFPFETMWTSARKGQLAVGDTAPDFSVKGLEDNTTRQLSSLWATTPVVLVFGSYT